MKSTIAVMALVAAGALAIPVTAAAKNYTQVGTATVSGVKATDQACKGYAGHSATGTATGTNLHLVCTAAKNTARGTLRNMIPAACAKYISSTKPCRNG